jgi:hypothetical protein
MRERGRGGGRQFINSASVSARKCREGAAFPRSVPTEQQCLVGAVFVLGAEGVGEVAGRKERQ